MATTTEMPPPQTNAQKPFPVPPETPKKKMGRPTNASKAVVPETFWEKVDKLPKDGWANRFICYVWRTAPIVDLAGGGKPVTIAKYCRAFGPDEIYREHGSGGYRFDLCERNEDGTEQKRIVQAYENLLDLKYPPKIAPGDWVDHPSNKNWLWAVPEIEAAERERKQLKNPAPPPQQNNFETVNAALDLAERIKGDTPNRSDNLTEALELAEKLRPKQDEGVMALILKYLLEPRKDPALEILRDELKATRAEIVALRQPPAQDTSLQGMFLPILQKAVDNLVGGGAGGVVRKETAAVITETLGEVMTKTIEQGSAYLPAILETIKHGKDRDLQIAQLAAATNRNPARPWEYQGPVATSTTPPQPAPTAPAAAPQTAPPVTAAQPPQGPMTPQVFFAKYHTVLQRQFPAIMHSFTNENGWYLQDVLIQKEGEVFFESFRKDATLEMLMQLVSANEQLKQVFQPEPKVREFFTQLLTDPPPDEEDETQSGEEEE